MGINVTALRNKLVGGGARPSLFYCKIDFPTNIASLLNGKFGDSAVSDAAFFMKAASIPESTLGEITKSFLGRDFKVPSIDRTFAPWTVTIINDEDYKTRHLFEAWLEYISPGAAIFEAQSGFGASSAPANVYGQMQVHQLRKDGGASTTIDEEGATAATPSYLGSYYFRDAFPTSLSELSLSWDDKDTIEELTVTFAYQYWVKNTNELGVTGSPNVNPFTTSTKGVEPAGRWAIPSGISNADLNEAAGNAGGGI